MHQVKTSIRRILPAELPTVTPIDEAPRTMNDQELLNAGLQRISGDIFSCIYQEERDEETFEWRPRFGQSLPGTVIAEGLLLERHAKLPADVRAEVMRSVVRRVVDDIPPDLPEGSLAVSEVVVDVITLPMSEVRDTDVVDETALIPHSWAGEPRR